MLSGQTNRVRLSAQGYPIDGYFDRCGRQDVWHPSLVRRALGRRPMRDCENSTAAIALGQAIADQRDQMGRIGL